MKKAILYLCALSGLAACDSGGDDAVPAAGGPVGIRFSGFVTRAAGATEDADQEYDMMTDNPGYGTVYIHHTRNGRFTSPDQRFSDAEADVAFSANAGRLDPVKADEGDPDEAYRWYWDGNTQHVFHAWNLPTDGEKQGDGEPIVTIGDDKRYGTVDLRMEGEYAEGDSGRLSNLEYFIGAAKGPVTMAENSDTRVMLDFRHLVAKIIVEDIQYKHSDGAVDVLDKDREVEFSMPNMPNTARWTTGVPESADTYDWTGNPPQEPHLLPLDDKDQGYTMEEKDYGVKGALKKGWCFYIYPCTFAERNTEGNGLGEIEFCYNGRWFYGTLASLTGLEKLNAGECIALTLILEEGKVGGLYPHIQDWGTSEENAGQHDRPGIYSEADWKKYTDWVEECKEADKNGKERPEPPAGLFDSDGNLNLYCDLKLPDWGNDGDPDLLFPQEGGKLKGNGYRVKTQKDWSGMKEKMDDIWIPENGKYEHYE